MAATNGGQRGETGASLADGLAITAEAGITRISVWKRSLQETAVWGLAPLPRASRL